MMRRSRGASFSVWTWDYGRVRLEPVRDPVIAAFVLEKVLKAGLWDEVRRFPPDVIRRLLPRLDLPRSMRRVVRLYVEAHAAPR